MFRPLVADVDLERKRIYVVIVLKHMVEACVLECVIFGPTKNCNASLSIFWAHFQKVFVFTLLSCLLEVITLRVGSFF